MKFLYIVFVIFLCGMIGTCIGQILISFVPKDTIYYNFLSNYLNPVWSIDNFDLVIFNISFKVQFNINSFTLFGFIIGSIFSLRKV
ncbi:MAG: hypothetical protein ACP5OB_04870 [Candidatus Ratteibacteria bacterium]